MHRSLATIGLLAASLYLSIVAADVIIYAIDEPPHLRKQRQFLEVWKKHGVDYDSRSLVDVVKSLRANGADAAPKINPGALLKFNEAGEVASLISIDGTEVMPISGLSSRLAVYGNELGQFKTYRSDRYGFNNPDHVWDHFEKGIILIGDSFGEGASVPEEATIAGHLRQFADVLNLSMGGNGPLIQLAALTEVLDQVKPSIIIWLYYEGNDHADLDKESKNKVLIKYLNPEFRQKNLQIKDEIDAEMDGYVESRLQKTSDYITINQQNRALDFILGRHLRNRINKAFFAKPPMLDAGLLESVWREAARRSKAVGAEFVVAKIPAVSCALQRLKGIETGCFANEIRKVATEAGINLVDLAEIVKEEDDVRRKYAGEGIGHFNQTGYAEAARILRGAIADLKLPRELN